jgi:hypothetical protein
MSYRPVRVREGVEPMAMANIDEGEQAQRTMTHPY